MGRHAATPPPDGRPRRCGRGWFGHGRTRALLSLGILAALGVGSTSAYWTDTGTVTTGTISSGKLNLVAADNLNGSAGTPTGSVQLTGSGDDWSFTAFTIDNLQPGESFAEDFLIYNVDPYSTVGYKLQATVKTSNNNLTSGSSGLKVEYWDNGVATTATGSAANGNRSQTCGGTQLTSAYYGSTTASPPLFGTPPTIGVGGGRGACIRVLLDPNAPNSLQGQSTSVIVTLTATQVSP